LMTTAISRQSGAVSSNPVAAIETLTARRRAESASISENPSKTNLRE
jgi:hypothetical protein